MGRNLVDLVKVKQLGRGKSKFGTFFVIYTKQLIFLHISASLQKKELFSRPGSAKGKKKKGEKKCPISSSLGKTTG